MKELARSGLLQVAGKTIVIGILPKARFWFIKRPDVKRWVFGLNVVFKLFSVTFA